MSFATLCLTWFNVLMDKPTTRSVERVCLGVRIVWFASESFKARRSTDPHY